ncbi:MAG: hypothetical protein WBM83_16035, partial [Flavobacteriaceae bacterium]
LISKRHYYLKEGGALQKISRTAHGKEKVTFLFSGINDNIAEEISIEHHNIPLIIKLKAI